MDAEDQGQGQAEAVPMTQRPVLWGGQFAAKRLGDFLVAWQLGQRTMPWRLWEWISDSVLAHVEDDETQARAVPSDADLKWLERGRAFGPGGDLSIRRDDECIYWRFIGPADASLPSAFVREAQKRDEVGLLPCAQPEAEDEEPPRSFQAVDFWASDIPGPEPAQWQTPNFAAWHVRLRHMLLWGQERRDEAGNGIGTWQEDRVAGVHRPLVYPRMSAPAPTGKKDDNRLGRVKLCYREYLNGDNVEAVWWLGLTRLTEPCKEEDNG